jgi:hypothetical protein
MIAQFDKFEIEMTMAQAKSSSGPGDATEAVESLLTDRKIGRQLDKIGPDKIRDELREYGAWDDGELADEAENMARIVWIAASNIKEEAKR